MIDFTDTIYLASQSGIDPDTGFQIKGTYSEVLCRVNDGAQKIVNSNGEEVIAQAKIYLPFDAEVGIYHKLKLKETSKELNIQKIEYKKDVSGKLNHIVVYV